MSTKGDKKQSKSDAKRLQQQKRQQQQQRLKQQLQKIKQKQQIMRKKSSPLVQYGLLEAYEFFMSQLALNGIPQANIFQFAAQSVLKYQKKMFKKKQQIKKIEDYNKSVIEAPKVNNTSPRKKLTNAKPNLLPFKGDVNQNDLQILNKLDKINGNDNKKVKSKAIQKNQNEQNYQSSDKD